MPSLSLRLRLTFHISPPTGIRWCHSKVCQGLMTEWMRHNLSKTEAIPPGLLSQWSASFWLPCQCHWTWQPHALHTWPCVPWCHRLASRPSTYLTVTAIIWSKTALVLINNRRHVSWTMETHRRVAVRPSVHHLASNNEPKISHPGNIIKLLTVERHVTLGTRATASNVTFPQHWSSALVANSNLHNKINGVNQI